MCDHLDKRSMGWVVPWLMGPQMGVVNSSFPGWQPLKRGGPQGSVLGPKRLIIFLGELDNGIKCSVMPVVVPKRVGNGFLGKETQLAGRSGQARRVAGKNL